MSLWGNKDNAAVTGLVGIVGATYGTTTTGTSVTAAATYNVTQKSATGGGTGGTFTIDKTGSGTSYSGATTITGVLPVNGGYTASSVVTISGAQLGGVDGTNDMTFTVNTLPTSALTGAAGTFTNAGTAVAVTQTFTGLTQKAGGTTTGTGAVFSVARTGGTSYAASTVVTVTTPGTGYVAGDTVKIDGALLGGVTVTNDLTITITAAPTAFTLELKPGSFVVIAGVKYKILKVNSNISATLTSLYESTTVTGATITEHMAPTYLSLADARKAVFVSQEEAQRATNKAKGINGAGWWLFNEYIDAAGKTRYKTSCLVAMTVLTTVSGDSAATGEDLIASDAESFVTLTTSPANKNTSGGTATFGAELVASASSGTLTYQWQRALAATPTRFVNINGATLATVATPGTQTSANTGDQYRVVLSSTNGAPKVTSAPATLTFVS
jgi:hypothetical protein